MTNHDRLREKLTEFRMEGRDLFGNPRGECQVCSTTGILIMGRDSCQQQIAAGKLLPIQRCNCCRALGSDLDAASHAAKLMSTDEEPWLVGCLLYGDRERQAMCELPNPQYYLYPAPADPVLSLANYEDPGDYVMNAEALTAWVTVHNVSIQISNQADYVQVSLYPVGSEADEPWGRARVDYEAPAWKIASIDREEAT